MNTVTVLRAIICSSIVISLGACSNLQEVRDFTSESAQLSGYTGIIDYTLGGYERSEAYLLPEIRATEKATEANRQASRESLLGLQKISEAYMTTLAKLAGADTFNIDTGVNKLATSIKASPDFGVQSATVDAYANLVHTVSKWVLEGAQEQAVRHMIRDGGEDFEKVIAGMSNVVRILHKVHENERRTVLDSLETMIMTTKATSENYLILALAQDRLKEKRAYYAKGDALYLAAAKGIQDIEEGHHLMAENLSRLDGKEVRDKLKQLRDDIKNVHDTLTMAGV